MDTPPPTETFTGHAWMMLGWVLRSWRQWEWPMYVVVAPLVLAPVAGVVGWARRTFASLSAPR
jgi:hypothetical protein